MNPIFLALLVGGALWYANTPSKPTTQTKLDPGYKIIIPCKQFDIYNEEASYKYAYNEFVKILPKLVAWVKTHNAEAFTNAQDEFQMKMFGCLKGQENPIFKSPMYYSWGYRIIRAGMKALVDKGALMLNIPKNQAILQANEMLAAYLEELEKSGLDIEGLPTTIEGDFLQ